RPRAPPAPLLRTSPSSTHAPSDPLRCTPPASPPEVRPPKSPPARRSPPAIASGQSRDSSLHTGQGMPVPVFVDEIFRRRLPDRTKPLRAPRSHPDEVARRQRVPRITQPVNPAALEHDQPVLHHVHLHHA